MKNLLLALSCALLLALSLPLRSVAAGPPEVVVVRIYDGGNNKITAVISRGAGQSEKVEFGNGISEKGLMQAGEGYQGLVQRLYQEGFTLKSTFGGEYRTTLIFTKEQ